MGRAGQRGRSGDRAAQESERDLLVAKEKRACGDKESKTHTPEMTRDALSGGDSSVSEHTDVFGGGEQEDDAEEEAHASGGVFVGMAEGKTPSVTTAAAPRMPTRSAA